MLPRICVVLLVLSAVSAAPDAKPQDQFRLERQDVIRNDNTLVVKVSVTVPKVKAAEMTKLEFRWHDQGSISMANGMWEQTATEQRAEVVIVAQVTNGTKQHPAMLMISTQQKSKWAAHTFQSLPLPANAKIQELIDVDVKDGAYAIGEQLKIGTVGADPLYLSVGSFPAE
jgi:hypothetical protein